MLGNSVDSQTFSPRTGETPQPRDERPSAAAGYGASLLIVIPCYNEGAHLQNVLDTLRLDPACANARIIVADGGSTDSSATIAHRTAHLDSRVVLMPNPRRIQSAGVNAAVRAYGTDADFLVRVDAHAHYPPNYLSALLQAQQESGADSVAVSMHAVGSRGACFQQAAATAQNSVLGTGGSLHRKRGGHRWIDHGHHALIDMRLFQAAGGYDETFSHNEDAEFDARFVAAGGCILLAADIVIDYCPRATVQALAAQYYRHGRGRARTTLKHRKPMKLRQIAPALVIPMITAGVLFAPLEPLALAPAAVWLTACAGFGLFLGVKQRSVCASAAGLAAAIMHFSWSAGFLSGLVPQRR